jgi:hypothetical protein
MNMRFQELVETLEPGLQELMAVPSTRCSRLPKAMPEHGVYLFSEGGEHLFVGSTNGLRNRIRGHCAPSATHYSASFAFKLACESLGAICPDSRDFSSREELVRDPVFASAFLAAKIRIGRMDLRFVEESDPVRQSLLQIYVATALDTPYGTGRSATDRG